MEKKNFPDFSVLMSVYEKENSEFLKKSLDSIWFQTVRPKEIVLVEDGPLTIDLTRVIKQSKNNGIPIVSVKLKENQGLGSALNAGSKAVTTNLIARMDSDDICVHNRFEVQLTELMAYPDISLIGGQIQEFDKNLQNLGAIREVPLEESKIKSFAKKRSPFNHPTVMIKKDVLDKVGGYQPFPSFEDYHLWGRILIGGYSVKNVDKILVYMRADSDLYKRRGGMGYLRRYYLLRKYLTKIHLISKLDEFVGDIMMTCSVILPSYLRKLVYKKMLRR